MRHYFFVVAVCLLAAPAFALSCDEGSHYIDEQKAELSTKLNEYARDEGVCFRGSGDIDKCIATQGRRGAYQNKLTYGKINKFLTAHKAQAKSCGWSADQ